MESESIEILSRDLQQIYESSDDYDVIVNVGKKENFKSFKAHSIILKARCSYFRKDKGIANYNLENISPEAFEFILKYIYTGRCAFEENGKQIDIIQVLTAANELKLDYLVNYVQDYIIANDSNWTEDNVIRIYIESAQCKSFTRLLNFFGEFIAFQPLLLFNSSHFNNLSNEILMKFLDRDDINCNEIEIWNSIIKWGTAKRSQLGNNTLNWSDQDFNKLKRHCDSLISKVKFSCITWYEYHLYVQPYKKILPNSLVNQLEGYCRINRTNATSSRKPKSFKIASYIISIEHVKIITDWITQRSNDNVSLLPLFSFKRLHHGEIDGMGVEEFHKNCDEKGPTLVVIKIKNSNDIIGGYNPFSWSSSGNWKVTDKSFIFSFKNGSIKNTNLSRVKDKSTAIHDNSNYKVGFGLNDLLWFNGESKCSSYNSNIIESDGFYLEDYEVFKVIKEHIH